MKKSQLIIMGVISVFSLLLATTDVNAASYKSISIGTNYKGKWIWDTGIDSSGAATISANNFKKFGYSGDLNVKPNASFLKSKFLDNSSYVLEAPIIHLAGHGNQSGMFFKYYNSDDYETGVLNGVNQTIDGVVYAGIQSYNMNNVRMFIFQGCNTASGTTNIAKSANERGAKVTMGWYDEITTESNEQWINNFTTKLASANVTVKAAIDYANSKSYSDANVKKVNVYGNTSLTFSAGGGLPTPYSLEENNKYITTISNNNDIKTQVDNYIKENINDEYVATDFLVTEINDNEYDLSYMINGTIKTNMGYSIQINDNIINIYDNMKTINDEVIEAYQNAEKVSEMDARNQVLNKYNDSDTMVEKVEIFDYYDSDNETVRQMARIVLKDVKTNTRGVYDEYVS